MQLLKIYLATNAKDTFQVSAFSKIAWKKLYEIRP